MTIVGLLATTLVVAAVAGGLTTACADEGAGLGARAEPDVRLAATPGRGGGRCKPGVHTLVGGERKALMRVTPHGREPRALVLVLHGAGSGGARGGLYAFRGAWALLGLVLVAPAAAGTSWSLSSDIGFVDQALSRAFARCRVDPRRVVVGGFSAGASFALWLGLANGDLFEAVVALSPGGSLPLARVGKPIVFLAHGARDSVIPIESGADVVAERLRREGYRVVYRRFAGGHRPVPGIIRELVRRALGQ
jgi:predicted esterase